MASTIAADAGLPVAAEPFTPVLRGVLPSRLRWYVEAPLTGGQGDATVVSPHPLWSPDLRFDARFLAPRLTQAVAAQRRRHRQHGERTDGSHDDRDRGPVGDGGGSAASLAAHEHRVARHPGHEDQQRRQQDRVERLA